jgi:hypothetical protein
MFRKGREFFIAPRSFYKFISLKEHFSMTTTNNTLALALQKINFVGVCTPMTHQLIASAYKLIVQRNKIAGIQVEGM